MLTLEEEESLLIFANTLLQAHKYQKALSILEVLYKLKPKNSSILRLYAYALISLNRGDDAIAVLVTYPTQELSKEENELYFLLKAEALWSSNNKKAAFTEIKKFIALRN
ncbi:MAG: tetratricopeptide repeat protein [Desulfovibrionaceae bacterium]